MYEIVKKVYSIKDIKRKIEGFTMLFDKEPQVYITGILQVHEGNQAYSNNFYDGEVTKILNSYLIIDEKRCSINEEYLKHCDERLLLTLE